jgi:hypothetical protein
MHNMRVCLGKDRTHAATDTMTATHTTVAGLMRRAENLGHKLYMDSFSSPDLFSNLHSKKINCCGSVRLNQKGMPQEFRNTLKLKQDDIRTRVRGNLTVMIWKDKKHVNMLMNIHHPPAEGNFHVEHGNALKPVIIQDYNQHMGYVDKSDHMTNTYSISRQHGTGVRNCSSTC